MAFSKPTLAFYAAAAAAHAYVADTLGHKAAAQLKVKLFDSATTIAVARDWQKAAHTSQSNLRRYIMHSNPVIERLDAIACARNPAPNGFELALWMQGELCSVAYGSNVQQQILPIDYVFAKPGVHPLKAFVLSCTHAAAAGFAQAHDAVCIVYSGPMSPGSVKQVERGAVPLSLDERNNMWLGENVMTPANIKQVPHGHLHAPSNSPPPPRIAEDYEQAYRQIFGRDYGHQ